jgi:hypothetical protein
MTGFLVFIVIPISLTLLFVTELGNNNTEQKMYKCQPVKVKKSYEGNSNYSERKVIFYCKNGNFVVPHKNINI